MKINFIFLIQIWDHTLPSFLLSFLLIIFFLVEYRVNQFKKVWMISSKSGKVETCQSDDTGEASSSRKSIKDGCNLSVIFHHLVIHDEDKVLQLVSNIREVSTFKPSIVWQSCGEVKLICSKIGNIFWRGKSNILIISQDGIVLCKIVELVLSLILDGIIRFIVNEGLERIILELVGIKECIQSIEENSSIGQHLIYFILSFASFVLPRISVVKNSLITVIWGDHHHSIIESLHISIHIKVKGLRTKTCI
jgi:hypothetical protein